MPAFTNSEQISPYVPRRSGENIKPFHAAGNLRLAGRVGRHCGCYNLLDNSDKIHIAKIREFQECAVCGDAYTSLLTSTLSFSDITEIPLICLSAGTKTYAFYTELFARYGLTIRPDIEAATADQILPMVRNNLGIGFVPEDFCQIQMKTLASTD